MAKAPHRVQVSYSGNEKFCDIFYVFCSTISILKAYEMRYPVYPMVAGWWRVVEVVGRGCRSTTSITHQPPAEETRHHQQW